MMNKTDLVPQSEALKANPLQITPPSENKEARVIPLPKQKKFTVPQKEFPVNKWMMPAEPHGYIQGHDNDCL